MTVNQAKKHYKTQAAIAEAAGCGKALVSKWKNSADGKIPELYARRIHDDSAGKVTFRHRNYGLSPPKRSSRK